MALAGAMVKTRVWEEFGEAKEEEFWSASKRFWQTDLLNPSDTPSVKETEAGDAGGSSITLAEVAEIVKKLLDGKAPGVDEIRSEFLKSLDVVGPYWLTSLCSIAWSLGTVPLD